MSAMTIDYSKLYGADLPAPAVRWARMAADHRNINALTSERLTDLGGGPTFYSCLVQVEKSGD